MAIYGEISNFLELKAVLPLNYLIELGHEKIGFIGGVETDMYGNRFKDLRQDVFETFLEENNIYNEEFVKIGGYNPKDGYNILKEMFTNENKPTALFVAMIL